MGTGGEREEGSELGGVVSLWSEENVLELSVLTP